MARNRIVVDVITEEPMTDVRLRTLAREASDWVHTIGVEPDDEVDETVDKNQHGHIHRSTRGENCMFCIENGCSDRLS